MTGTSAHRAYLRQFPHESNPDGRLLTFELAHDRPTQVGRDPSCQLVIDSAKYTTVSRFHAELRPPIPSAGKGQGATNWQICDLETVNGTYVNGKSVCGCQVLKTGDHISLSRNGPEFVFETDPNPPVTLTQLFPLLSTGRDLPQKAYLIPGGITVAVVVLLFATIGQPLLFNQLLAIYLVGAAYYFIYQLCGKQKPWILPIAVALGMMLLLATPIVGLFTLVFRSILPGDVPDPGQVQNLPLLLVQMFFGVGLMEELLKALPLLFICVAGLRLPRTWQGAIGLQEPLDGILLGTAAAAGFTLFETLGQYVPSIVDQNGALQGLQLLIPRVLGSVAGHMAYSGYLGYFIGLSVLRPSQRWSVLGIGYLSAAILHALWNTAGYIHPIFLAIIGILSYACLSAAILKARAISPTRQKNFATRFFSTRR